MGWPYCWRFMPAGVQIATKTIDEGAKAARLAAEAGADFVDLNCGCPIYGALLPRPKTPVRPRTSQGVEGRQ